MGFYQILGKSMTENLRLPKISILLEFWDENDIGILML